MFDLSSRNNNQVCGKEVVTITSAGKNEFNKYVRKRSVSEARQFRLHEQA